MHLFEWPSGMKRVSYVVSVLAKEGYDYAIDDMHLRSHLPFLTRVFRRKKVRQMDTRPERVRKVLEKLGGTYVKLGQVLSLRPDLIPHEYCHEFSKLQDEVAPFSFDEVKAIVEKELGNRLSETFSSFEKRPLGSASIGQVHLATLRKERRRVVVKIRRPGIDKLFAEDIDAMYFLAHKFDRTFKSAGFSAMQIVKEFERYTKEELDYSIEADHIMRFYRAFSGSDTIKIPQLFRDYSTPRILTMEHLDGVKLSELLRSKKRFERHEIARKIFELVIRQVFEMDIFHADLHPGNIMIMPDGKIGLIDFGITGSLTEQLRDSGIKLYVALMDGDVDGVYEALMSLDDLPSSEQKALKTEVRKLMEGWRGKSLEEARFTRVLHEMLDISVRHSLHVPPDMILLGKALLTAEGTCATVYPSFDVATESKPYLAEILKSQVKMQTSIKSILRKSMAMKDFIEKFPGQTLSALKSIETGTFKLSLTDTELSELGRDIDTSSDRVSAALMVSSFIVAGALILQTNLEPRYWGYSLLAYVAFGVAFFMAFILIVSFFTKHQHERNH